jgi:hypothetical protein
LYYYIKILYYDLSFNNNINRARYCNGALAICTNIKNYFERKIASNGGVVLTVPIPFNLPSHMPAPIPPPVFKNRPRITRKHRKRDDLEITKTSNFFDDDHNNDELIEFTTSKNNHSKYFRSSSSRSYNKRKIQEYYPRQETSAMLYAATTNTTTTPSQSAYQALYPSSNPKPTYTNRSPSTVAMAGYMSKSTSPSELKY